MPTQQSSDGDRKLSGYQRYIQYFLVPSLLKGWGWWLMLAVWLIAVLEAIALIVLIPLKQKVPYVLEVEHLTGRVQVSSRVLGVFHPSLANIGYFIRVWATNLFSVNEQTLNAIPDAAHWMRGNALNELNAFLDKEKPGEFLANHPGFRRQVIFSAMNWGGDGKTCFLDMVFVDRIDGIEKLRQPVRVTVDFYRLPATSAEEQLNNPIGLTITHFSVSTIFDR